MSTNAGRRLADWEGLVTGSGQGAEVEYAKRTHASAVAAYHRALGREAPMSLARNLRRVQYKPLPRRHMDGMAMKIAGQRLLAVDTSECPLVAQS